VLLFPLNVFSLLEHALSFKTAMLYAMLNVFW